MNCNPIKSNDFIENLTVGNCFDFDMCHRQSATEPTYHIKAVKTGKDFSGFGNYFAKIAVNNRFSKFYTFATRTATMETTTTSTEEPSTIRENMQKLLEIFLKYFRIDWDLLTRKLQDMSKRKMLHSQKLTHSIYFSFRRQFAMTIGMGGFVQVMIFLYFRLTQYNGVDSTNWQHSNTLAHLSASNPCHFNSLCQCTNLPNETNLLEISCHDVALYKFPGKFYNFLQIHYLL